MVAERIFAFQDENFAVWCEKVRKREACYAAADYGHVEGLRHQSHRMFFA